MTPEEVDTLQSENDRLKQELDEINASKEASVDIPPPETLPETKPSEEEIVGTIEISDTAVSKAATPISTTIITAVTFNKSTDLTLYVGNTNKRSATTTPTGGSVVYASSNAAVATVATDGTVTCKTVGNTVVSATSGGVTTSYELAVVAATSSTTSSSTASSVSISGKSGYLTGYTVTVNDKTTVAANSSGKDYPITTYYFYSSSGKVLGTLSGSTYKSILKSYTGPLPDSDWGVWLTEQFNLYRGLSSSTGGSTGNGNSGSSSSTPSNTVDIEAFRQEVIRLTNVEREKVGLPDVESDNTSMEFAQIRADELTISYSHKRPDGTLMTYGSLNFAENIYKGPLTPKDAVNGWMNSPGHKAAMLADYSDYGNKVGVGVYQSTDGIIYWVQEFVIWDADA